MLIQRLSGTGSSPGITRSSSCWPLPETPAMPTISPPRLHLRVEVLQVPPGWVLGLQAEAVDAQPDLALAVRLAVLEVGRSSPIIIRTMVLGSPGTARGAR